MLSGCCRTREENGKFEEAGCSSHAPSSGAFVSFVFNVACFCCVSHTRAGVSPAREAKTYLDQVDREMAMIAELQLLEEWIPEQMEPGTLFVLENAGNMGKRQTPTGQCSRARHAGRLA